MRIVMALLGLILAGIGIWLFDPLPRVPGAKELSRGAEGYAAQIIRDDWGTPHIYGARDADTAFGLAYAHAEDDFETIQQVIAATRGTLARYKGAGAAPTDYLIALMGVWETVDLRYAPDVPDDVKAIAEAYAAALNLYAADHRDEVWAGLAPFAAEDVIAGFIFKPPFFYGFDRELLALFEGEGPRELALDPAEGREAFQMTDHPAPARGSNAFAVAPRRSGDGVTRLLINSHQPMTGPVAWYEAHLVSDEGLNMTGGVFPGTPVILHGFNDHLGWANTVNTPDLVDVYRLEVNPDDPGQYRFDGAWRDFEQEVVTIPVRLFGPFVYKAKRILKESVHGPVIDGPGGTYAIAYAGRGEIRQLEQYYRLNRAENLREFMAAMRINALPSINYIYADEKGNIAFIHNAQYPDRLAGWDWQKDLPGDRPELVWSEYRPFEDIPRLVNPRSGFVFNANNTPFTATDGPDNLSPDDMPAGMGLQTEETNRSMRIMELTGLGEPITRERLLAIKFDKSYAKDSLAADIIADVLAADWSGESRMAEAAGFLAEWDMSADVTSRHAALGVLTMMPETRPGGQVRTGEERRAMFRAVVDHLHRTYGRIDPEWGGVNRLIHGEADLPLGGASGTLRSVQGELMADGRLRAFAGDTWIALVEWDRRGRQTASVIHQFGSATLNEASPHYADQAPLFAAEGWRPALRELEEIEAVATSRRQIGGSDVTR
ncbi:acylase [Parvularcula marina]|uniref:acylase n=1 Tax=Parvularcula marina TaxID=2292771 RepID=UPI0035123441